MISNEFISELEWRGMIHDITPGVREYLTKHESALGYIGFDPTADSLHIGSLMPIMTMIHFQKYGHKPLVLLGGATGMVGDPSGKLEERTLISAETLQENTVAIKCQLERILRVDDSPNSAQIINNNDWFKDFRFMDFVRKVGKHFTVNYMLSKDSVKNRLEYGLSFTEFSYQLVQGYDFYWLYEQKGCKLQMGGSDQWGNMTTGIDLIRRKTGQQAYALTTPLVQRDDGSKFGKTQEGNIWLNSKKTSPYLFYQYWVNVSDQDAKSFIKIFTEKTKEDIFHLITTHEQAPHKRLLQKELAKDITIRVHSQESYEKACKASLIFFGDSTIKDLEDLDEEIFLSVFESIPHIHISRTIWNNCENTTRLLSEDTHGKIFSSKGEVRRAIKGRGVSINKSLIEESEQKPTFTPLQGKYILVQKGKKNYYLIAID